MAKSNVRLFVFSGPGQIEGLRAAIRARRWTLLLNCDETSAGDIWPSLKGEWKTPATSAISLHPFADPPTAAPSDAGSGALGPGVAVTPTPEERRPGRESLVVEIDSLALGVSPSGLQTDPPSGSNRVVVLDASWTHIPSFPERDEVRQTMESMLGSKGHRVYFITNIPWDAELFRDTAADMGQSDRCTEVEVSGFGSRMLRQAREIIGRIKASDVVLISLVPRRDDRGAFQRLRSEFAERTAHVWAYPILPLSCGPGQSREEALQSVGAWLPTTVIIAGGPMSEQVLLARFLEENAAVSRPVVAIAGGEYRLPSLTLARQAEPSRPRRPAGWEPSRGPKAGLVVVTYGRDGFPQLAGAGLPADAQSLLPKLRVGRRGKAPEQIVHDVESAFSSRGMPIPAVRFIG